jgi:hypothetical protein
MALIGGRCNFRAQKRMLCIHGSRGISDNAHLTGEPCESMPACTVLMPGRSHDALPTGNHMQGTMIYLLQHERTYIAVRERMLRGG